MLTKEYLEILELLTAHNVEFVIVGAYAMGVFGYTRATGDIDIFISHKSYPNSTTLFDRPYLESYECPNFISILIDQDLIVPKGKLSILDKAKYSVSLILHIKL